MLYGLAGRVGTLTCLTKTKSVGEAYHCHKHLDISKNKNCVYLVDRTRLDHGGCMCRCIEEVNLDIVIDIILRSNSSSGSSSSMIY